VATKGRSEATKDATATMGSILPDDIDGRDAVHVAVLAVTAGYRLAPGQDVGLLEERRKGEPLVGMSETPIGIVDPFLKMMVAPGQRFWLFLYPRTITSLRHQWTHPAFGDEAAQASRPYATPASKLASEQWLRDFVKRSDCPPYEDVIATINGERGDGYANDGEYLHFDGQDAHGEIPPEFWDHVEVVTERAIPKHKRPLYFSCSC
jgi:hypothetical protein